MCIQWCIYIYIIVYVIAYIYILYVYIYNCNCNCICICICICQWHVGLRMTAVLAAPAVLRALVPLSELGFLVSMSPSNLCWTSRERLESADRGSQKLETKNGSTNCQQIGNNKTKCHYFQTWALLRFSCSAETCTALIADLCTVRSAHVGDRTRYNNLQSQLNQCRNHCADIDLRSQLLSWPINTGLSWRMKIATISHQPLVPKKCFYNLIIKQRNCAFIGRLPSKVSIWLQVFWNSMPLTLQVPRRKRKEHESAVHSRSKACRVSVLSNECNAVITTSAFS